MGKRGPSENKRQRIDPQQIEYRFQLLVNRSEEEGGQVEMGAEEWVGRQEINELDHTQRAARLRDLQLTANTCPNCHEAIHVGAHRGTCPHCHCQIVRCQCDSVHDSNERCALLLPAEFIAWHIGYSHLTPDQGGLYRCTWQGCTWGVIRSAKSATKVDHLENHMYTHYKVKSLFCRTCNNFFGTPQEHNKCKGSCGEKIVGFRSDFRQRSRKPTAAAQRRAQEETNRMANLVRQIQGGASIEDIAASVHDAADLQRIVELLTSESSSSESISNISDNDNQIIVSSSSNTTDNDGNSPETDHQLYGNVHMNDVPNPAEFGYSNLQQQQQHQFGFQNFTPMMEPAFAPTVFQPDMPYTPINRFVNQGPISAGLNRVQPVQPILMNNLALNLPALEQPGLIQDGFLPNSSPFQYMALNNFPPAEPQPPQDFLAGEPQFDFAHSVLDSPVEGEADLYAPPRPTTQRRSFARSTRSISTVPSVIVPPTPQIFAASSAPYAPSAMHQRLYALPSATSPSQSAVLVDGSSLSPRGAALPSPVLDSVVSQLQGVSVAHRPTDLSSEASTPRSNLSKHTFDEIEDDIVDSLNDEDDNDSISRDDEDDLSSVMGVVGSDEGGPKPVVVQQDQELEATDETSTTILYLSSVATLLQLRFMPQARRIDFARRLQDVRTLVTFH